VTVLAAATGEVRWTAELGAATVGPAAVAGDTIVVGTADGRLVALAAGGCGATTCAPLWEVPLGAAASAPPIVIGDAVLLGSAANDVVAAPAAGCGAASCPAVASIPTGPSAKTGGPIYDRGRVLVGTADGQVVALALPA
jgi:outer membrane protein assembly factor BamB